MDTSVSFVRPYAKYSQIFVRPLSVGHDEYWDIRQYHVVKKSIGVDYRHTGLILRAFPLPKPSPPHIGLVRQTVSRTVGA